MRSRLLIVPLLAAAAATLPARAQQFGPQTGFTVENPVLRRIWTLGMDSSLAARYGQVLLDSLGPRLTGTPGMEAAQRWLVSQYRELGIDARQEPYGTWRGWRRGRTHLDLIQPRVRSLEATMLAWSPGTPQGRPVRGEVVALPDADSAGFAQWLGGVRGKVVLVSFPEPTCRPDNSWEQWATRATLDAMREARTTARRAFAQRLQRLGVSGPQLQTRLEEAGAAAILTSNWSSGWGVNKIFGTQTRRAPVLDVACEDYGLLWRLAENRQGPEVELMAEAEMLGEVPVANVIARIPGAERADEFVMLSAHFDSWDAASGATDNGTGTLVMLEAMRLLRLAYPTPRRTIMVGHWNGEEQGLNGSRAWAADNPQVVDGLQALFNQDNGTGRISNTSGSGLTLATGRLAGYLAHIPVDLTRHIAMSFPGGPAGGGSDHASFICAGAPGFGLGSNSWDYGTYTWHTNRDTYDKVAWDEIRNNATLVAMLAYLASEDPDRMPRERRTVLPPGPTGQPGGWPACQPGQRSSPPLVR